MYKLEKNPYYLKALDYIEKTDLQALPKGTHIIDEGNVWVNIVEANMRPATEALLEAHDEFIDLHIPFSCAEGYGVKQRCKCTAPKGEMDKADDILFFTDPITEVITGEIGKMTVFTPEQAHAPLVGMGPIRKAIFKVRANY